MKGPQAQRPDAVRDRVAVIGVGNPFRRDDGAGPETIARLRDRVPPGVALAVLDGEPTGLMEAWSGAELAIVVDTVVCDPPSPGRIHRVTAPGSLSGGMAVATHGLGFVEAVRLAAALDRLPHTLLLLGVEAADVGIGPGLSPQVTAALPALVDAVLAELEAVRRARPSESRGSAPHATPRCRAR